VSQPFDRGCKLSAPGKVDSGLGEFWVDSTWDIPFSQNLSFFERNQVFLNVEGQAFLDISHLSGADSDGDGRAAVATDLDHDGMPEMIVRQVGGGPLFIFENQFPKKNYLKVSLRGTKSNRLGIGARLIATIGEKKLTRELYPINSFQSQAPSLVEFGLADFAQIDKLTVLWPSGEVQDFMGVPTNQHIVLEEGKGEIETVRPGTPYAP